MIFLSAQPDEFYFTWQLDLQLFNFSRLGIPREDIHVLIACKPGHPLSAEFRELTERWRMAACFFIYSDTRRNSRYPPSVRPHIIGKHLAKNPRVCSQAVFYHDADIIFRELPDFDSMLGDDTWYVSDTRSYTGSSSIISMGSEKAFHGMCKIVGVDPEVVIANDNNCGGAQYLFKCMDPAYWQKIEDDSESLFVYMKDYNDRLFEKFFVSNGTRREEFYGIQAWCADMWAVYWNALLSGIKVEIHPDLEFSWAKSPIEKWESTKILHYSGEGGGAPGPIFRKTIFMHHVPYYDPNLDKVSERSACLPLVNLIKEYRKQLDMSRIDLRDLTFLIPIRVDSESRLENLYIVVDFINKYFDTHVLIAESDTEPKVDRTRLPACCSLLFIRDQNPRLFRTRINNLLVRQANTDIIAIYDTDVVIPVNQITESIQWIRAGKAQAVAPYNGTFVAVTKMFKTIFSNLLDPDLLEQNFNKFPVCARRSYGGAIFIKREAFITAGMENEYFASWGPDDVERIKRMQNLGYKVQRMEGNLYHLPHDRLPHSGYASQDQYVEFMEEYIKISNMQCTELQDYISSWEWTLPTKSI